MKVTLPNFIGIGAQKAGTTSLFKYLQQHPELYFSPLKNLKFFCTDWSKQPESVTKHNYSFDDHQSSKPYSSRQVGDWQEYLRFFEGAQTQPAVGEFCPGYLCLEESASLIAKQLPNAKLIAILRHPVDRLFSHYNFYRQNGRESCADIIEAVENEELDRPLCFGPEFRCDPPPRAYVRSGLYGRALKRYREHFAEDQIFVCNYEKLKNSPDELCAEIFRFLGVDDSFAIDFKTAHNVTQNAPNSGLRRKIGRLGNHIPGFVKPAIRGVVDTLLKSKAPPKPVLDQETRSRLSEYFHADIEILKGLGINYF